MSRTPPFIRLFLAKVFVTRLVAVVAETYPAFDGYADAKATQRTYGPC